MSRLIKTFALLCILFSLAATTAHTFDKAHKDDRAFFRQVYAYREAGWKNKNPKQIEALMAKDFVLYDLSNLKQTRGQQANLVYTTDIKMEISVSQIVFTKYAAIVTQVMTRSYKVFPRYNEVDTDERVTSRDIWSRTGNGWQEKRSKILLDEGTQNGEHFRSTELITHEWYSA